MCFFIIEDLTTILMVPLRSKYSFGIQENTNYVLNPMLHADVLFNIMDRYIDENMAEFSHLVETFLEEYIIFEF